MIESNSILHNDLPSLKKSKELPIDKIELFDSEYDPTKNKQT